jgi:hypothetical protein
LTKADLELEILPDEDYKFPDFGYCFFTFLTDSVISKVPPQYLRQPSIFTVNVPPNSPF